MSQIMVLLKNITTLKSFSKTIFKFLKYSSTFKKDPSVLYKLESFKATAKILTHET